MNSPASNYSSASFTTAKVRNWLAVVLLMFFVASMLGLLMRVMFVIEVPSVNYTFIKHAHSHVALMGWAYMLLVGLILIIVVKKSRFQQAYSLLLGTNVLLCIGMTFSFSLQGYSTISIVLSTLHMFLAYAVAVLLLIDLREKETSTALELVRWGIYWHLISSLGLWMVPVATFVFGKFHPIYFMSVQFFLHFQFNGWFTFVIMGMVLHQLGNTSSFGKDGSNLALLNISLLLTYTLSVTWSTPVQYLFYINSAGVAVQLYAIHQILKAHFGKLKAIAGVGVPQLMLTVGLSALLLKFVIQFVLIAPSLAADSYGIRPLVIGFVHLLMLGGISLTGLGLILQEKLMELNPSIKSGGMILIAAFALSEILLMGQGLLLWLQLGFLPYYHEVLFGTSVLFPVSIFLLLYGSQRALPTPKIVTQQYVN